jgi:hypothetical protein
VTLRVRARQLHEITYSTVDGVLPVAIVLLEDDRVAIYEWDEEHGYFPLVGPFRAVPGALAGKPPVSAGHREWKRWTVLSYPVFAERVNNHPAKLRDVPPVILPALPSFKEPKPKRTRAIRCPFCKARHNEWTQVVCEHLVAEGDPETQMVYHWPLLDQLFQLAEQAYGEEIEFAPLGADIRGWDKAMQGDERDLLTGDFLREIPGFVSRSRTVQGAMTESVYFWIFVSPRSRPKVEAEFTRLRTRLVQTLAEAAR